MTAAIYAVQEMKVTSDERRLQRAVVVALSEWVQILLGTKRLLAECGGQLLKAKNPSEYYSYAYLNPQFCWAIQKIYGYNENRMALDLTRLYKSKFPNRWISIESRENIEFDESQDDCTTPNSILKSWTTRMKTRNEAQVISRRSTRSTMQTEPSLYLCILMNPKFSCDQSRTFWSCPENSSKMRRLARLARLFHNVPASSIPQEWQFSEVKRRNAGLRNRTKIATLDRDSVVFLLWDSTLQSLVILFAKSLKLASVNHFVS